MGHSKKLFSTSFGGFKKSEVVEYIEELNRKAKLAAEQSEFELSRLESEIAELETKTAELNDVKQRLSEADDRNRMLSDDVGNQRFIIEAMQNENQELKNENQALAAKLALLENDYYIFKQKAEQYDEDKRSAGGVLERAKAESARTLAVSNAEAAEIIRAANEKARENSDAIIAESEKQVAENIRKVKYLYKRRDELLSAFEKVKDAAGGFYDSIASTLSRDIED